MLEKLEVIWELRTFYPRFLRTTSHNRHYVVYSWLLYCSFYHKISQKSTKYYNKIQHLKKKERITLLFIKKFRRNKTNEDQKFSLVSFARHKFVLFARLYTYNRWDTSSLLFVFEILTIPCNALFFNILHFISPSLKIKVLLW